MVEVIWHTSGGGWRSMFSVFRISCHSCRRSFFYLFFAFCCLIDGGCGHLLVVVGDKVVVVFPDPDVLPLLPHFFCFFAVLKLQGN